jgi:uncharacterized SAM-binding protein YcdF (DUF218 family)
MFFVFSKILIYLLAPITWILIFLVIGVVTKKPKLKKYSFRISLILFILFSNPFLLNSFAKWWDVKETSLPEGTNYSCVIVLGGFTSEDANGNGYFSVAADRFIQAVKLKAQGKVDRILISGGNGNLLPSDFRESDWVASQLRTLRIPDSTILAENRSRNSYENALFSKKLLDSAGLKPPYLLITSAFHMRRAFSTYRKNGVNVIPFPCNYIAGRGKTLFSDFIPSAWTLATWQVYIKEIVGYGVYAIKNN